MDAKQLIKWSILSLAVSGGDIPELPHITSENIDEVYDDFKNDIYDYEYEFREGEVETDISCDYSRHYESNSVATKAPNGIWVGWTYWYGGGKHGEPEAIDWMSDSYILNCVEEEKLVIVRTFLKE
jgi:hypothetical protein